MAPDCLPDGERIAYSTENGIRLVTADNVTPARGRVGPAGAPGLVTGRETACDLRGRGGALYLVDPRGNHLVEVPVHGGVGSLGLRPAWYPIGRVKPSPHPTTYANSC